MKDNAFEEQKVSVITGNSPSTALVSWNQVPEFLEICGVRKASSVYSDEVLT